MVLVGLFILLLIGVSTIIGGVFIILGIVFLRKSKKNHKLRTIPIISIIIGILFCFPLLFNIVFNSSAVLTGGLLMQYEKGTLLKAVESNDYNKAKNLVDKGADVNVRVKMYNNTTPLLEAVANRNYKMAKLLIGNGADVNKGGGLHYGTTPLIAAAFSNYLKNKDDLEMVKLLLENGAEINSEDAQGKTALVFAKMKDSTKELADYLEKNGAK